MAGNTAEATGGAAVDLNTVTTILKPADRSALPTVQPGDAWLAGGTWLFSEPQVDLRRLIDLESLRWPSLQMEPDGLRIGATCRIAELAVFEAPPAWRAASLIQPCCRALLGSFKIWNMATVGGNLCLGLPAGPMVALLSSLDGICRIWTPDGTSRAVPAADFVTGPQQTVLQSGEILRAIDVQQDAWLKRTAFRQISLSPQGRSAALLIGTLDPTGAFALTVTASTPCPVKLRFAGIPTQIELDTALEEAIPAYHDDVHGSPGWRRHMTLSFARSIREELAA
jgi:CO/xanthine dehydrogenase FAD-binding subunit